MFSRAGQYINDAANWFVERFHDTRSATLFLKVLQCYVLIKVLFLWPQASIVSGWAEKAAYASSFLKIVLMPVNLAVVDINVFFAGLVIVLLICLWRPPSYVMNALFFWFSASLFFLRYPAINGSDLILATVSLWGVALQMESVFKSDQMKIAQVGVFNFSLIMLRFQVIIVYLLSGWDKLMSVEWRTGDVFTYIRRIEVMFNPTFADLFQVDWINLLVSWGTIIFEIGFGILIMFQRTRLLILCAGIIFHLMIWWMLSLPDFALIMMVTYIIFLTDSDWVRIRQLFKRQPL